MTPTTAPLPLQQTRWFQLSAAALVVAMIGLGAGRAEAQAGVHAGHGAAKHAAHDGAQHTAHGGAQHAAHHRMASGKGMGMPGMAMPERMLDAVGASAEQKAKLREIYQAAGDDMRAQHQAGRALHAQMAALMAAPQVDAAAAESLRQQQLTRHDTVTKRALQAMLDAQAVLTPEQRAKLAEHMAKRQQMKGHHQGHHGHHGQHHERRAADAPKG